MADNSTDLPPTTDDVTPSASDSSAAESTNDPGVTSSENPSISTSEDPIISTTTTPPPEESTSTPPPPITTSTPPPVISSSEPPPEISSSSSTPVVDPITSSVPPEISSSSSSVVPSSTSVVVVAPTSSSVTSAAVQPTLVTKTTPGVLTTTPATAISITTTDANGNLITTAPAEFTSVMLSTDANGNTYTITQVVKNTAVPSGQSSRGGGSGFFDNTGAVAGVFVVIGLAVTAGVVSFIWFMLRRRRRQRLDRDVAAAAAAAAAAHNPRFEDDDEPSMTQYSNYYASTNSHELQPAQTAGGHHGGYDYEDPTGGYDPYVINLIDAPSLPGDRSSVATAPGFAGFGADSATTRYYNDGGIEYGQHGQQSQPDFSHTYGDPQYDVAHHYAGPDEGGLAPVAEMSAEGHTDFSYGGNTQHSYNDHAYNEHNYNDDAYLGNYAPQHPAEPERRDSVGSVNIGQQHRDLTVTNK